jgi:hypothetical protein
LLGVVHLDCLGLLNLQYLVFAIMKELKSKINFKNLFTLDDTISSLSEIVTVFLPEDRAVIFFSVKEFCSSSWSIP